MTKRLSHHVKPRLRAAAGLLLSTILISTAAVRADDLQLSAQLRPLLTDLPHARTVVGACVVDLETGDTLFSLEANRPLVPASNMKIFTMAAALSELGRDFTFETVLATDGMNLILIGDGDPSFGDPKLYATRDESITADFQRWAKMLAASGVSVVPGDLIIDESIFDRQLLHPTWERADLGKAYAAPVSALNLNENCVSITVRPGSQPGSPTSATVWPQNSIVSIINRCTTGDARGAILHHEHDSLEYRVTGQCNKRWPFAPISFPEPGLLFAEVLKTVLEQEGIRISGGVRRERVRLPRGELPPTIGVLARKGTPLADVLKRVGKDSQNLFAEALLKRAGYARAARLGALNPEGTWSNGAAAAQETATALVIDTSELHVVDGSGLSRDNRATAGLFAAMLRSIYHRPEGRMFRQSLSVAGVDGSLRNRLKDMPDRVVAKTGTMRGVRALSGYVDSADGRGFAFSVIFNNYPGSVAPYREIQDRFCRVLIRALDAKGVPQIDPKRVAIGAAPLLVR